MNKGDRIIVASAVIRDQIAELAAVRAILDSGKPIVWEEDTEITPVALWQDENYYGI